MKILVVTHYFPEHKGGVEVVAGEIINQLSKNRVEIKWFASNTDSPPQNNQFLECISIPTSNIIEKKFGFAYPLWSLTIYRQLWRQIKQVDLVHLHEYIYIGNLIAFYIAKKQGKPVIITQHIGFIPFSNKLFSFLLKLVNNTLGKYILSRCDRTVFCSKVIEDYWDSLKTKYKRKPAFIPNGVDTNIFYPVKLEKRLHIKKQFNLNPNKLTILFVGRFVEKKGLKLLEKLARNYQEIEWLFAGWGNLNPKQWNLNNVHVWENLQKSQLTPLYQCADLLILPSVGEAFPLVIQEAMACGTPAFVSDESANQYPQLEGLIFSASVNYSHSEDEWSRKLEEIVSQGEYLTSLREKVSEFAQNYWSWEKTSSSYYSLFQQNN